MRSRPHSAAFTSLLTAVVALAALEPLAAQRTLGVRPTSSGGPLLGEQAAYDVRFYDLDLEIDPQAKRIAGALGLLATIVQPTEWLVLDLDEPLEVSAVERLADSTTADELAARPPHDSSGSTGPAASRSTASDRSPASATRLLRFERRVDVGDRHRLWVHLGGTAQPGSQLAVKVRYAGAPRVAPRPPWVGGFTWATTESGLPWFATSVQSDGADLWWPVKDHPSDEPDNGMALHFTVPKPLVATGNGRLVGVTDLGQARRYDWRVTGPINNYAVALAAGPFVALEETYTSVAGSELPVTFWVLPEHLEQGRGLMRQIKEHLAFFEDLLGPYPFRADKYGVVETPFLGMEHQTIIAYGSDFKDNQWGYDFLHHHELGHEWWGNLVTALDWRDFWIHEGFCSYMQALYAERLHGREAYLAALAPARERMRNLQPMAPSEARTATEVYFLAPDYLQSDGDNFNKGVWVLHGLRYLLGEQTFFTFLRRMAYPSAESERLTDGSQTRFATTADVQALAEQLSGHDLGWYFALYARQPALPRLLSERREDQLLLRWETPGNLPFPMPVEVALGDEVVRFQVPVGGVAVTVPAGVEPVLDPNGWLLRALDPAPAADSAARGAVPPAAAAPARTR